MIFDLAMSFRNRRLIGRAKEALDDHQWLDVIDLLEEGLSPNQMIPVGTFLNPKIRGDITTFLHLSKYQIEATEEGEPPSPLFCAFKMALEKGGDLTTRAPFDTRGPLDHQANIRSLDGWKLIAEYHTLDFQALAQHATELSWSEGHAWASAQLANENAQALNTQSPPAPSKGRALRF